MDAKFQVICDHTLGEPEQSFTLLSCPRCLGSGFYEALSYGGDGKVVTVSGVQKLSQQIYKILTESKRTTGYGFDYSILSGVITPSTITAVKSEVLRCLQYLSTNQQQEKMSGFNYLPSEEIANVGSLDAFIDPTDPRRVNVTVNVITVSGANTNVTIPIKR